MHIDKQTLMDEVYLSVKETNFGRGESPMTSFLNLVNIKKRIMRMRKQKVQLELYYPKNTYDRLARREMKTVLTRFNDLYYKAYPMMINGRSNAIIDYHPRTHARQYEVQRAIKLCKSQKVRRKDVVKIEEYLNLQYIIEEQLRFYDKQVEKARHTKQVLSKEPSTSYFSELFAERMNTIESIKDHYTKEIDKLEHEKRICERAIYDLLDRNHDFWGHASKLIGGMITESVRNVVDVVDQSFRRRK